LALLASLSDALASCAEGLGADAALEAWRS